MAIRVTPNIFLEEDELTERFIRASGPGGQNVNKVSTAVELRFDAFNSPNLPERVKRRLPQLAGRKMTSAGVIVLVAESHRSQARNRADALERLIDLLRDAAAPPPPKRIPTKPSRGAKERRLASKKRNSEIKAGRSKLRRDD